MTATPYDVRHAQRRTLKTLVTTQTLGGLGVGAAISVNAMLAKDVSGQESLAGLAQTFAVLGTAMVTLLIARVMDDHGRRVGLTLGYAIGVAGTALSILAGVLRLFPLLLVGAACLGATTAANNQSRYAATDLSEPAHRGRDLSLVVWATTIGSVLGPNLSGPGKVAASAVGLPPLTGAYLFSGVGMIAALAVMWTRLRPDPLLLARAEHLRAEPRAQGAPEPTRASGWALLRDDRMLRLAAVGLALSHAVMVSVMVMTPIHMDHGHASLEIIGLVISIHILGMFALSPLVGMAVDRWGSAALLAAGGVVLLISLVLSGTSHAGASWALGLGLFLLGVGWSLGTIACSTLVTAAATPQNRPAIQGVTDLITSLTAAVGGAFAGVVVGGPGFAMLNALAGVLALGVLWAAYAVRRHTRSAG
ncbi:MAG: MFS transporter [Candidatus Phosphoribacter sp.]|nr:MFS transporter [Actinomycetales bacterium]